MLPGRLLSVCGLDRQAHKAPRLAAAARNRAHGVDGLLVSGAGLVAVLGAQVARGALGDV